MRIMCGGTLDAKGMLETCIGATRQSGDAYATFGSLAKRATASGTDALVICSAYAFGSPIMEERLLFWYSGSLCMAPSAVSAVLVCRSSWDAVPVRKTT